MSKEIVIPVLEGSDHPINAVPVGPHGQFTIDSEIPREDMEKVILDKIAQGGHELPRFIDRIEYVVIDNPTGGKTVIFEVCPK